MPLTVDMEAALERDGPHLFVAVKIELPSATIRLVDGAHTLTMNGETFTGIDETYGVLAALDPLTDGVGGEAPRCRLTLHTPTPAAAKAFRQMTVQGSPVTIWEGVIEPVSGLVVEDPDVAFRGELDFSTTRFPGGVIAAELDCNSVFERFFDDNEGARLSSSWHQSFWPGELGLDQVTGVTRKLPWGVGGGGTGFKGRTTQEFIWFHKPFTGGHFSQVTGQSPQGLF